VTSSWSLILQLPILTFRWPWIVINSYNKTNQIYKYLKFIFGIKFYMFRTVPLSIIRSFSLYTQQWYMSYSFADSLRTGSGRPDPARKLYDIYHCCVYSKKLSWWWTEELSETVEFYSKNKFVNLVNLVGFVIRTYKHQLRCKISSFFFFCRIKCKLR